MIWRLVWFIGTHILNPLYLPSLIYGFWQRRRSVWLLRDGVTAPVRWVAHGAWVVMWAPVRWVRAHCMVCARVAIWGVCCCGVFYGMDWLFSSVPSQTTLESAETPAVIARPERKSIVWVSPTEGKNTYTCEQASSIKTPKRTLSGTDGAAACAMPGDLIALRQGVYREAMNGSNTPMRSGEKYKSIRIHGDRTNPEQYILRPPCGAQHAITFPKHVTGWIVEGVTIDGAEMACPQTQAPAPPAATDATCRAHVAASTKSPQSEWSDWTWVTYVGGASNGNVRRGTTSAHPDTCGIYTRYAVVDAASGLCRYAPPAQTFGSECGLGTLFRPSVAATPVGQGATSTALTTGTGNVFQTNMIIGSPFVSWYRCNNAGDGWISRVPRLDPKNTISESETTTYDMITK